MSEKSSRSWLWPSLAWFLGVVGMTGLWQGMGVWLDSACLWLSVFAVIDIALILRFTAIDPGPWRSIGIAAGGIVILLASQWLIAANAFGLVMGLYPHEAAKLLGPVLVWEFTRLRLSANDWIWLLVSASLVPWFGLRK